MGKGKALVNGNKGKHSIDEDKEKAYQKIISKLCDLQDNLLTHGYASFVKFELSFLV